MLNTAKCFRRLKLLSRNFCAPAIEAESEKKVEEPKPKLNVPDENREEVLTFLNKQGLKEMMSAKITKRAYMLEILGARERSPTKSFESLEDAFKAIGINASVMERMCRNIIAHLHPPPVSKTEQTRRDEVIAKKSWERKARFSRAVYPLIFVESDTEKVANLETITSIEITPEALFTTKLSMPELRFEQCQKLPYPPDFDPKRFKSLNTAVLLELIRDLTEEIPESDAYLLGFQEVSGKKISNWEFAHFLLRNLLSLSIEHRMEKVRGESSSLRRSTVFSVNCLSVGEYFSLQVNKEFLDCRSTAKQLREGKKPLRDSNQYATVSVDCDINSIIKETSIDDHNLGIASLYALFFWDHFYSPAAQRAKKIKENLMETEMKAAEDSVLEEDQKKKMEGTSGEENCADNEIRSDST